MRNSFIVMLRDLVKNLFKVNKQLWFTDEKVITSLLALCGSEDFLNTLLWSFPNLKEIVWHFVKYTYLLSCWELEDQSPLSCLYGKYVAGVSRQLSECSIQIENGGKACLVASAQCMFSSKTKISCKWREDFCL